MNRRSSSEETAAAFLSTYLRRRRRFRRRNRKHAVAPASIIAERIVIDVAPWTFAEILDCVVARVRGYQRRSEPVPHITQVALKMLHEATEQAP